MLQAGDLDQYIAGRLLREKSLDVHSAFQLNHESVRIRRYAYRQRAWGQHLYTLDLYKLFMHCLVARALGCNDQLLIAEKWFEEDIPFLCQHRPHHFTDRLHQRRALLYDSEFLHSLSIIRRNKAKLDYDDSPFHFQVFPYDFAAEEELLSPGSHREFNRTIQLDPEVEAILVELLTGVWM